jgi:solute:Na+ symporter, SSS family
VPVTTPAARFEGDLVLASGEIRPRVRSPEVWRIVPLADGTAFGTLDYAVLVAYLAGMVGVGLYFMNQMKNTDDFFRGGQQMQWWAAGCSIFATMLSAITFMAIPAKAYAQDWVYLVGNLMIVAVAPVAVYLALPFFRRIDATSAYEYLELRFNRGVRLFASGLFTLFHVFRMAIVMSLAALGLVFINPDIRSLFDSFLKVIGVFMGVLGGLFALGMLTRRTSGAGAFVGVVAGAGVMFALPVFTEVQGYLYPAVGITTCFLTGLLASVAIDLVAAREEPERDLEGLTIFTQRAGEATDPAG